MNDLEYSQHPINELVSRVGNILETKELTDPDLLTGEAPAAAIHAIAAAAATTKALLDQTPPQLVSGHGLAQLQNAFQSIFNELTAYQADRNQGHLQNARAAVEQAVLPQLWAFGPVVAPTSTISISDAVAQLSRVSTKSIQQLAAQRDQLAERADHLHKRFEEVGSKLDSLAEAVSLQKAEAGAAVASLQQQYSEKESERAANFELMLKNYRDEFRTLHEKVEEDQRTQLQALIESRDQAARIVQVVGNIGVTGNYQKIANAETNQADTWRRITIGFFCGGLVVAGATFLKFWSQPFSPETAWSVVIRLMYALAITSPAWYTARESARHRTNADRARQTELELASLGPFIELMPEEKKNEIRGELTTRYFGNGVSEHTVEQPVSVKDVKDLALDLVKALQK